MIASADDLVRASMSLRDEATMLDGQILSCASPILTYGMQHLQNRRDALRRAADYLDEQAKTLRVAA